jgi:hypothetical protein
MPTIDAEYCEAVMCGGITQAEAGIANLYECARMGFTGARPCTDDSCRFYTTAMEERGNGCGTPIPPAPAMPWAPPLTMDDDGLEDPAAPPPQLPAITPYNLTPPMPSITAPVNFGPSSNPVSTDTAACQFSTWVDQNPVMALIALAGLALLVAKK